MSSGSRLRVLVVVAVAGCAVDGEPGGAAASPPTLGGVNQVVHWTVGGSTAVVGVSPTDVYIEALLAGHKIVPALLADDGTFTIDAVAQGPYWLRFVDGRHSREDVYIYTDATQIDLGRDVVGIDSGLAASVDTELVVDATGMSAWQDLSDGDFVIPELGYRSAFATFFAANPPVPGDTSLADLTYFWLQQPLSVSPAGAMFVQLQPSHDDALGLDYDAPVKAFTSSPIAIADASTARLSGAFTDPPAFDLPVHWARADFVAQAAAMHVPSCTDELDNESYWVHALPGHGARGELSRAFLDPEFGIPDAGPRVIDEIFTLETRDLSGTFHITNPYPSDWLYAKYSVSFAVSCPLAGLGSPGNAEAEIGLITAEIGGPSVANLELGPASAPQIDGLDLREPQTGVGGEPTVSWTAPAIGTPTAYELHISELDNSPFGGLTLHEDVELIVPGDVTSVTLPQDVLADGTIYQIRIRAIARDGQNARTAPFRSGMPVAYADLFTNYFVP